MTSENVNEEDLPAGLANVPPAALDDWEPPRRRRWPWILGAFVVLLGAFVALGPSLISSQWLNGVIRDWLKENVNTPVDFDRLEVSWSDGIRITGLSVSDRRGGDEPLLYAPLVEVDAAILPLFTKRLEVERFVFQDPVVRIEHEGEGRLNSQDVVRRRKRDGKEQDEGSGDVLVLPEIDVPIEVRNLTLVFITEAGRTVERTGIEFRGDVTTRGGPTTFALSVPDGDGGLTLDGDVALFDADGALLPTKQLVINSRLRMSGIDAADNADLLALFMGDSPASGVIEGEIEATTHGSKTTGRMDLTLRGIGIGEVAGTKAADREDLRISGSFRRDGKAIELNEWRLRGQGVSADADVSGTLEALSGSASFDADFGQTADALRALGLDVPKGLGGRLKGTLEFTPSPSRGEGRLTLSGMTLPGTDDAAELVRVADAEAALVVLLGADEITLQSASFTMADATIGASGRVSHAGAVNVGVTATGDVAGLLETARPLGVVPRDLAVQGRLDAAVNLARAEGDSGLAIRIDRVDLANDGMSVHVEGILAADGALAVTAKGSGALGSLLGAATANDAGDPDSVREVRGTFDLAATIAGTRTQPHVTLDRLKIDGDLQLEATGVAEPGGRVAGSVVVNGAVRDAISLARGLGLIEGDVRLDGKIDGRVELAGTRDRPRIPNAVLTVTGTDVDVDMSGTVDSEGAIRGSVRARAGIDALLRVAHDRGLMATKHTTGGDVSIEAVFGGTRAAPEVSTLTFRVSGPVAAQFDGSLAADREVHLRGKFRGALGQLASLLAAVRGTTPEEVTGDFDGNLSVDGMLDAPRVSLTALALRSRGLEMEARGIYRADRTGEVSVAILGPLASAFDLAHASGMAAAFDGTGTLDASIEGKLSSDGGRRGLVTAVTVSARSVEVVRTDGSGSPYREDEIALSVPIIHVPLDGGERRPLRGTLSLGRGLRGELAVTGGTGGKDLDAEFTVSGAVQPLLRVAAFATGGVSAPSDATIEGALRARGPLDGLQFTVPGLKLGTDDGTLAIAASTGDDMDGRQTADLTARGELETLLVLAHAAGVALDLTGEGTLDSGVKVTLEDGVIVVREATVAGDGIRLRSLSTGEPTFADPRVRFRAEDARVVLATKAVAPFAMTLAMSGLDLRGSVGVAPGEVPEGGADAPRIVTARGTIDVREEFAKNQAHLFPDIAFKRIASPFTFEGDVSRGRDGAEGWTGTFDLTAEGVTAPHVRIATSTATGSLEGGALVIKQFAAKVNGGTASGSARIGLVGEKPQHETTLHAENIEIDGDLAPLLARATPILAVGAAGTAGGRFGLDTTLTAKGMDGDTIKRTVSGNGTLKLDGVYAQSDNWVGKLLEFAGAGSRLEVRSAEVPFEVRRGRVTTSDVDMGGSAMDLRLGGTVGTDGLLDYTFKVKPTKAGGAFQKYAKLFDKDGYIPMKLSGDISSPSLDLPSLADAVKGGLGGLLDGLRGKDDTDDEDADDGDGELSEEERRKRRRERRKRKKEREEEERRKREESE